jgi:hypothetical protein
MFSPDFKKNSFRHRNTQKINGDGTHILNQNLKGEYFLWIKKNHLTGLGMAARLGGIGREQATCKKTKHLFSEIFYKMVNILFRL